MKKVFIVFGTRPEAIKMCPVIEELKKRNGLITKVVLTGQHREMLDQVMDFFSAKADYDLNIMKKGQSLQDITCSVINGLTELIHTERPDLVLVHGDTTTSYAAALTAFYERIKIAHVEAGLRTFDLQAPYPEEFNRQSIDLISDYLFAPTELSKSNLIASGVREEKIYVTGNTVIDAMKKTINSDFEDENTKWAKNGRMILLTIHRRENFGNKMRSIFASIERMTHEFPDVKVIYPIHKNPDIRKLASEAFGRNEQIRIIEPLDVLTFHNYMSKAYMIMTDSGGVQEEAPSLGVPVLVLRDKTERPEGLETGTLMIAGTNEDEIYKATKLLLLDNEVYQSMRKATNPYGDGHASERICDVICKFV